MFLQEGPADTFTFMIYGFIVILGIMALYIASLWSRTRNLRRDEEVLSDMKEPDAIFHDE